MIINFLAFAVPFFLFFIGLEYWFSQKQGKSYHKFESSIANINIGIVERIIDLFAAGGFYFFYDFLHQKFAIFEIQPTWWLWVLLLLVTDFLWYWYHRFGHEINLFWGFHVVHHSSEEFNYTAGTRITYFQAVIRTLFWSVLPIIGFPAEMITTILLIHGAYPFFTHTQTIGKLGWLEYILVTPSHHRVHHASNEAYLDKNYGDIFIFWDKLFGTFAEEKEPATYGLTKQLNSYSLIWQHFHYLVELFYAVKQQKRIINKLKIIFGRPADFDAAVRPQVEQLFLSKHRVRTKSTKHRNYVLIQTVFALSLLFVLLLFEHYINTFLQVILAFFILITIVNCGAILEQRRWIFYLEIIRLILLYIPLIYYFPTQTLGISMIVLMFLVVDGLGDFTKAKRQYLNLVYGR